MDESHPPVVEAVRETAADIDSMTVRGAAAIADAAAVALATQAEHSTATSPSAFRAELRTAATTLYETRPTAVSLPNALRYVFRGIEGDTVDELRASTVDRVEQFRENLAHAQEELGRIGASRLRDGDVVMTHCHSTDALSCIEHALDAGTHVEAIVRETRPRKQGHITAAQLREWGVPVTLIVDNAARRYLNDADHVLVGADSITADGGVVNKIGTSGLAVTARERGVPVVVAAQTIKLHPDTMTGHTVEIEMRDPAEVLDADDRAEIVGDSAADGLTVENPAFDVTPPRYVDAIVTERGQYPPESIVTLMHDLFGATGGHPWTS